MKRLPRVTSNTRSLEEQEMKLSIDCNTTEVKKKAGAVQKHCWCNRKGHQVNHVFKDEPVASCSASTSADTLFISQCISSDGFDARSDGPGVPW